MTRTTGGDRRVVVGVDGSAGSATALAWALEHADQLGTIVPVLTFVAGPFEYGFGTIEGSTGTGEPYRSEAVLLLERFLAEHAPSLVGSGVVLERRAGPGLVAESEDAALLVVGTRGWSSRGDLSIGSVGAYCARHSDVPVALIPPEVPPAHDHLDVVVGFDGSSHSRTALAWALTHLRPSAQVIVVQAFAPGAVVGDPLSPAPEDMEARAQAELEEGVAEVLSTLPVERVVTGRVIPGDAREVLAAAAAEVDVLVVGARGHGMMERLLLGSVATALAHHPTGPTIVVPPGAAVEPG